MKIFRTKTPLDGCGSRLFSMYFGGMRVAAFDIETTGLSRAYDNIILSGFCEVSEGEATVIQYFAESPEEESLLLEKTLAHLGALDAVITYNGRKFDMPFTRARAENQMLRPLGIPFDFDLYPVLKKHSPVRQFLPRMRQTNVEEFAGIGDLRKDTIDGARSIMLYRDWQVSHEDDLLEKILLHNHDDVLQLYRLLGLLGKTDIHAAMRDIGVPFRTEDGMCAVTGSALKSGFLTVKGRILTSGKTVMGYVDYGTDGVTRKLSEEGYFSVKFPLTEQEGYTLADLAGAGVPADEFEGSSSYGSGYLVLAANGKENDRDINLLSRLLAKSLMEERSKGI